MQYHTDMLLGITISVTVLQSQGKKTPDLEDFIVLLPPAGFPAPALEHTHSSAGEYFSTLHTFMLVQTFHKLWMYYYKRDVLA